MGRSRIYSLLLFLVLSFLAQAGWSWPNQHGITNSKYQDELSQYIGIYEGVWLGDLTPDPYDDIGHQKLGKIVLNVGLDDAQRLRVDFYQNLEALKENQKLDILGKGCKSNFGQMLDLAKEKHILANGQESEILVAQFKFSWGGCSSRILPVAYNNLILYFYHDLETGEPIVQTFLERTYRLAGQVYVKVDGKYQPVQIVRVHDENGPWIRRSLRYYCMQEEYKIKDEINVKEDCTEITKELKSFLLPFPIVGVLWVGYTKQPKFKVDSKYVPIYHEGIFKMVPDNVW